MGDERTEVRVQPEARAFSLTGLGEDDWTGLSRQSDVVDVHRTVPSPRELPGDEGRN